MSIQTCETFLFEGQHIADSVKVGDILMKTSASADMPFCAVRGFQKMARTKKAFLVKRREDLDIVPDKLELSRDGGDYFYYAYEVVEVIEEE